MDLIIRDIFIIIACVSQYKANYVQHTPWTGMCFLRNYPASHHKIECSPDEMIYIAQQEMRIGGVTPSQLSTHKSQCSQYENKTSEECLRSIPADFDADFTSYFNASKKCNRERMCTLTYNDYYNSVIKFLLSCGLGGNIIFQNVRIMANYECLPAKEFIHIGNNITVKRRWIVYLVASNRSTCRVRGKIHASRILQKIHVELNISDGSNQLCTDWNGVFQYNKDLSCVEGFSEIFLDIKISRNDSSPFLWIEIKGGHLQIDCGEDLSADISTSSNNSSFNLVAILASLAGVLIVGVMIFAVLIKMCFPRCFLINKDVERNLRPKSTFQNEDSIHYSNINRLQNNDSNHLQSKNWLLHFTSSTTNCPHSNTNKIAISLPLREGDYSIIEDAKLGDIRSTEKDGNCSSTNEMQESFQYSLVRCFDRKNTDVMTNQTQAADKQ